MQYTAKVNTLLKKSPVQGSTLADNEKVVVQAGKKYPVETILETDGLHSHVQLGFQAGAWWIFLPHWNSEGSGEVKAKFSLKQANSDAIIYGALVFTENGSEILRVGATSGQPGYQYENAHTEVGLGCIPPGSGWEISTNGYHLDIDGVNGMFYHITPDPRYGRSEFGLHRDANATRWPGSAGCIVVKTTDFNGKVRPLIEGLKERQPSIPLTVNYT
jgi:hypothetical protein